MMVRKLLSVGASVFLLFCGFCGAQIIVIDPGHGGNAPSGTKEEFTLSSPNNAITPSGLKEKDLALELALIMRDTLQKNGMTCFLTRESDENPDFKKRAELCAKAKPDFIVSIHFNASSDRKALGTVAMVGNPERNPNFATDMKFADALTAAISKAVQEYVPESKARSPINDSHLHNGMGSNFFRQLASFPELAKTPKCFLEVEFIDNKIAENGLIANRSKSFPKIASAFAEFIASYGSE